MGHSYMHYSRMLGVSKTETTTLKKHNQNFQSVKMDNNTVEVRKRSATLTKLSAQVRSVALLQPVKLFACRGMAKIPHV
jgi:hypothetical protein